MVLEQASNSKVTIETVSTSLPLDESLVAIKRFLSARLAARGEEEQTKVHTTPDIVIDIGFLGIPGSAYHAPEKRNSLIIYPIRVHFSVALLGPVYRPIQNEGPCPRCLERRWTANLNKETQQAFWGAQKVMVSEQHVKLHYAALEMLWTLVESDLYNRSPLTPGENGNAQFYALSLDTLQVQRQQLIADSACPICASSELDKPDIETFQLATRPKRDTSNYRLVDPLEYSLPEEAYINPVCGMLGSSATIDLFHTVTAPVTGTYRLLGKQDANPVGWGGHTTKFLTSRRIGLLEGLERYCGHWPRAKNSTIFDSYNNLCPDALDPLTCGLYHPDTYRLSSRLEPFSPDMKFTWVWGYSFRQARPILVPEQLAYYFAQTTGGSYFVRDSSNGCVIGSCLEEAVLHGLIELIERDNFLIHWYAKLAAPRIDPRSSRNRKTLHLLDRIERLGYDTYLLDTRLDLPIPTVTAVAMRKGDELGKLSLSAGASFEPEEAISSAICEMAAHIAGLSDRVEEELEMLQTLMKDYTKVHGIQHHILLYGLPEMAKHASFLLQNPHVGSIEEIYEHWNAQRPRNYDLRADLQYVIERIVDLGMDVIVVDQTAQELKGTGLKVVRVIVPGLVPIDFGWGMHRVFNLSRMSTVPRTTGYSQKDFDLAMLNLTPHPFP